MFGAGFAPARLHKSQTGESSWLAPLLRKKKNAIVDFLNSKAKTKSKFYFNDFLPLFPDKKPREVKKILTALIDEEVLEYWSSGSTTMYGLKGAGKQAQAEGEE